MANSPYPEHWSDIDTRLYERSVKVFSAVRNMLSVKMKLHADIENYPFPYLYDESQTIAKAYDAACTPDFFMFDANSKLVYRGQLDDSRPGNNVPVTGIDLRHALDCLIENKMNTAIQKPSIGCSIKWKV